MFEGTPKAPKGTLDRVIEGGGGNNNVSIGALLSPLKERSLLNNRAAFRPQRRLLAPST
jgi:hypothetical protein